MRKILFIATALVFVLAGALVANAQTGSPLYFRSLEKVTLNIEVEEDDSALFHQTFLNPTLTVGTFEWFVAWGDIEMIGAKIDGRNIDLNQINLEKGDFTKLAVPLFEEETSKIELSYRIHDISLVKKDLLEIHQIVLENSGYSIEELNVSVRHTKSGELKDFRHFAIHGIESSSEKRSGNDVFFQAKGLSEYATFSFTLDLSKDSLVLPLSKKSRAYFENLSSFTLLILSLIFPVLGLTVLLGVYSRHKRSQGLKETERVRTMPPSNAPPAVVGLLLRDHISKREIAATIIDLLFRDYLILVEKEEGMVFGKKKETADLNFFERKLIEGIFKKKKIKRTVKEIQEEEKEQITNPEIEAMYRNIYNTASDRGLFETNPLRVQFVYRMIGIILFFLSFLLFLMIAFYFPAQPLLILSPVGLTVFSYLLVYFGKIVAPRTTKGEKELKDWLEFKNFLAGSYVLPEANQQLFEKNFAYSFVLLVEDEWFLHFKNIVSKTPSFYTSSKTFVPFEEWVSETVNLASRVAEELEHLKGVS